MRISLSVGLLFSVFIFANGTTKSSAQTVDDPVKTQSVSTFERIVDLTETSKSPLLNISKEAELTLEGDTVVAPVVVKHIVQVDESLSKIATIHNTSWQRIYDKNTNLVDPNIISEGLELIIPTQDEVIETRVFVAPEPVVRTPIADGNKSTESAVASKQSDRGSTNGNGYVEGYCTWYVKNRRPDMPNNLGNASTWVTRASSQGMSTGSEAQVGAVGQRGNHVVYVESINTDGTITISDMNYKGLYVITTRNVNPGEFKYIY